MSTLIHRIFMKMGSMERTLTTKSIGLREFSQWTAATTLVAAGTLALFSATTLDKLSRNGDISIDLQAFRKVGSASLALDRVDDQRLILEDARLLKTVETAAAEKLPAVKTGFVRIGSSRIVRSNKARFKPKSSEKEPLLAAQSQLKTQTLSAVPVTLRNADAEEIADLERARDPIIESRALAMVYQNLRFKFYAAADTSTNEDYGTHSVAIAESVESFEYEELPEFAASDFLLPLEEDLGAQSRVAEEKIETAPVAFESVLAGREENLKSPQDEITTSASSSLLVNLPTAAPAVMTGQSTPGEIPTLAAATISTPGLDLVPSEVTVSELPTERVVTNTQFEGGNHSTGPPKIPENLTPSSVSTLHARTSPAQDEKYENSTPDTAVSVEPLPADSDEYSSDIASAYENSENDSSEYSGRIVKASQLKGDKAEVKKLGSGVYQDPKGITIDFNEKNIGSGASVFVGKPNTKETLASEEVQRSLRKFSFANPALIESGEKNLNGTQSSAVRAAKIETTDVEPAVDTKKCETTRDGVEALNAAAEKESLSICRRELSLEGVRHGTQARWWEAYENNTEHWPTISYLKPGAKTGEDRIPLLSTGTIRILSALSKTNTHTGTGILFGEVPKGLEIQLLGRSDAAIYLDSGMKVSAPGAGTSDKRQFLFLNVEPGLPLLSVKNKEKGITGTIPLVVKSGMATHIAVPEPNETDLELTVIDASSAKEMRLSNLTVEVIGQPGRLGITDVRGNLKIRKVTTFEDFPLYVDVLKDEKSYKNRFRINPSRIGKGILPLFYFNEKRVAGWLAQLAGGLSPYSGIVTGVVPASLLHAKNEESRHLKIGVLEKKSSLIPERYLLDGRDSLLSDTPLKANLNRYIGVQIPEGPATPSIVDGLGKILWSELIYAQPGVINVISPEL